MELTREFIFDTPRPLSAVREESLSVNPVSRPSFSLATMRQDDSDAASVAPSLDLSWMQTAIAAQPSGNSMRNKHG